MNRLLGVIGLVMAIFSFQASAANIALVNGSGNFGNDVVGDFHDTWTFTTGVNNGISASATNTGVINFSNFSISGVISDFAGTLDNKPLTVMFSNNMATWLLGSFQGLGSGLHTLKFFGNAGVGASYGGNIAVAQTPIPAAVWLFGSALMGLMSARRKKA